MQIDEHKIAFVPVTHADLPLLRAWLKQPHCRQWWGEPDEELALIRATLEGDDGTRAFVVRVDGAPAAYIQSWKPSNFARSPQWLDEAPWLADVPADTLGIDVFVGPTEMLERGMGSRIVRAFAERLFEAGATRLIIDPDSANGRAVRAYEKAGFREYARHDGPDETTLLMELLPTDAAEAPA